jgi:DNA mismatch endonuclease (patch repair protein)
MAMVEYHASMSPEEKARRSAQMSIATKERIAAGTTNEIRYGWKHTEETKAKISARRRTWFANLTPEEKSAYMDDAHAAARRANDERFEQTGHRMPEESRLAVGAGRRTWMQTPEAKKKFFRFTAPERAFAQELEAAGTPYKWQFSAAGHIWDFFIPPNTVVDVDGCFWHGCPIHRPGCGKPDQQERDARAVVDAAAAGYKPQRIWEHELISYAATKVSK